MIPAALRHRGFAALWAGVVASNVGTWMQNVARAWILYRATGDDPLWLGWLGACFAVPMIVLPPLLGGFLDRRDRIRVLFVTQLVGAAVATAFALLSFEGTLRPWHLLVGTVIGAIALAFENPTRQALIAEVVPATALDSAVALNAGTFSAAGLVGPALAGIVLARAGAGWLFAANALSFFAMLAVLPWIASARTAVEKPERAPLEEGLRFLAQRADVTRVLVIAFVAGLGARAYPQLLPVFARTVFHRGPETYGAMLSASGIGALLAALVLSLRKQATASSRESRITIAGFATAAALILFGIAPFGASFALLAAAGAAATVFATSTAAIVQHETPPPLRGRILSLHVSAQVGAPALGALLLAPFARTSARLAVIAAGLSLFAALALVRSSGSTGAHHAPEGPRAPRR